MAITKLSFTKIKAGAKASTRYYVHRFDEEQEPITRAIFDSDGKISKYQAYRMIDRATWGTTFFRMIISPNKKTEDQDKRLNMREVTADTMRQLQKILRTKEAIDYLGIEHTNTDNRHVHALFFIKGRINKEHLRQIRNAATEASHTGAERALFRSNLPGSALTEPERYVIRETYRKIWRENHPRHLRQIPRRPVPRRMRYLRASPVCPNCRSSMAGSGRWFECDNCGIALKRTRGFVTQLSRKSRRLELSVFAEAGEI